MSDVLVYALVAVMALVLLDALVLAVVVLARAARARRSPRRFAAPDLSTLLYAVPARQDVSAVLTALTATGCAVVLDPLDERVLLIACAGGREHRDEVRAVLARAVRRPSRTPGLGWSEPVRFADEV